MSRAAAILVLLALAGRRADALQCPTLALQVAPLQAACANATTVCTACVAAIAVQLEPAFQSAGAQGVALLNASMADIQSCLVPIVMPALPSVPNLASVLACAVPTGQDLLAAAAAALNGTATGQLLDSMLHRGAPAPAAAPGSPLTAAGLLTALASLGAAPGATPPPPPKAAAQSSGSRASAATAMALTAAAGALLAAL